MKCHYTMVQCPTPHLNCDTCPVKLGMTKGDVPLVAARNELPDPALHQGRARRSKTKH